MLIVGQGLAGSLLAWQLLQRGRKVLVVDRYDRSSASRVAAGLINPIVGKRFSLIADCEAMLRVAVKTYRQIGQLSGRRLYRPLPLWRELQDPAQAELLRNRRDDPRYARFLDATPDPAAARPRAGVHVRHAGQLQTQALLDGLGEILRAHGALLELAFDHAELDLDGELIRWRGRSFGRVVFCEGHAAAANPWFSALPLQPAQGEILTLQSRRTLPRRIISAGHWLVPESDRLCRVGANYQWQPLDRQPAPGVAAELLGWSERQFEGAQQFEILDHRCAIRPGIRGGQPVLGTHPDDPRIAVLNGLGSRGSLYAPWYSALLADHLLRATPLPPAVDVARFREALAGARG